MNICGPDGRELPMRGSLGNLSQRRKAMAVDAAVDLAARNARMMETATAVLRAALRKLGRVELSDAEVNAERGKGGPVVTLNSNGDGGCFDVEREPCSEPKTQEG